jgi:GH24 family phage-related lysozyme (muramidase)
MSDDYNDYGGGYDESGGDGSAGADYGNNAYADDVGQQDYGDATGDFNSADYSNNDDMAQLQSQIDALQDTVDNAVGDEVQDDADCGEQADAIQDTIDESQEAYDTAQAEVDQQDADIADLQRQLQELEGGAADNTGDGADDTAGDENANDQADGDEELDAANAVEAADNDYNAAQEELDEANDELEELQRQLRELEEGNGDEDQEGNDDEGGSQEGDEEGDEEEYQEGDEENNEDDDGDEIENRNDDNKEGDYDSSLFDEFGGTPLDEEALATQLMTDEAFVPEVYEDDLGYKTYGVGHRILKSDPLYNAEVGTPVDPDEAMAIFKVDLQVALNDCRSSYPEYDRYPQEVRQVLGNMMFNMGAPKMAEFKRMNGAIAARDWNRVAAEMTNSRWYKQVGARSRRLVARMESVASKTLKQPVSISAGMPRVISKAATKLIPIP